MRWMVCMSGVSSKEDSVAVGAADMMAEALLVVVVVVGSAVAVTGAVAAEAGVDDGRDEAGR